MMAHSCVGGMSNVGRTGPPETTEKTNKLLLEMQTNTDQMPSISAH